MFITGMIKSILQNKHYINLRHFYKNEGTYLLINMLNQIIRLWIKKLNYFRSGEV